ncbi:response regulator transcription factor [Dyadobacter aurulentus]|uniref:response regulator transcription factor n=1 Tax=Dyadobacter sp. UC 10 TaxID=2605428 RepID=UPI0011F25CC7|nr:response regulator transcription factor [Dyadobacter sp. UC 10]KAA0990060.1 response regulator transcription factor [Dyadobacter sp. UC 10]
MLTIGIIDPFPIMRTGLSVLLNTHYEDARLFQSRSLEEFPQMQQADLPFVVILGISENAKENRLISVRKCKKAFPTAKIVVYDYDLVQEMIFSYFMVGIDGYLLKQHSEHQLITCIESIIGGKPFLSPELLDDFVQPLLLRTDSPIRKIRKLTSYEFELAVYLSQGQKNTVIAGILDCKPSSVSSIKRVIFKKLMIQSLSELRGILNLK